MDIEVLCLGGSLNGEKIEVSEYEYRHNHLHSEHSFKEYESGIVEGINTSKRESYFKRWILHNGVPIPIFLLEDLDTPLESYLEEQLELR